MGRQGGSILMYPGVVIPAIALLAISEMAHSYDPQPDKAVLVDMTTGWLNSDGSQTGNSLTRQTELREVGSVILWQYENNGGGATANVGNHSRTIEIRINTEAQGCVAFSDPAATVTLLPVTDSDADPDNDLGGVNSAQFFAFDPLENGRYVQLSITDNYRGFQGITIGGDRVGLGEVRFAGAQSACVNRPAGDLNGDCVQDLRDLAVWISTYLDCGTEPASACP